MTDYATLRTMMVDTQVRPSDVTKFPVIDAMLSVPREIYVPDALKSVAYSGDNLEVAPGRVLLEPRTLAKMLDTLDIGPDQLVLDLGCWLGYSAAIAARMAEAVVAVEEDEDLAAEAEALLAEQGFDNVAVMPGPLAQGSAKHGPYDAILVQGGVEAVPEALLEQLKIGGRIACVFMQGALGVCRIGLMQESGVTWRDEFNATAPILPGFEQQRAFAL